MIKKKPITASERQKKVKKHVATIAKAKEDAKRRKPFTPQPSQSLSSFEEKSDSTSQTNFETQNQENPDSSLTQTQTEMRKVLVVWPLMKMTMMMVGQSTKVY
ncbi:hypothetical protein LguiB_019127 [Lonicera macranthoides]